MEVDKLTAENKQIIKENRRCERQIATQEEDRQFLIKQLVQVKKEVIDTSYNPFSLLSYSYNNY